MRKPKVTKYTPVKAIRLKCLDCCCGQAHEVKLCDIDDCPLYPYRFGKNPNRAGQGHKRGFIKKNTVLARGQLANMGIVDREY